MLLFVSDALHVERCDFLEFLQNLAWGLRHQSLVSLFELITSQLGEEGELL